MTPPQGRRRQHRAEPGGPGHDGFTEAFAERLLRFDLGDPDKVILDVCLVSGGLRLLFLPLYVNLDQPRLALQSGLAFGLYLFLAAVRRLPNRQGLLLLALGPEWLLWSFSNTVALGGGFSFQLYPLLLLPAFVLCFHQLKPVTRLALLVAPLALYAPFFMFFRKARPLVELAEQTQHRLAVLNELMVAVIVVLFAGVALLEHWRARRLAEEREATQAQLVEDLAHELRTPLATLLTAAQGAKVARQRPERVAESLEWIEDAARSAGRLVERLLELASPDGPESPASPVELSHGVRAAVERLRPVAEQRDIVLELLEVSPCLDQVNAASLEIVLQNLLSNAVAHSPRGAKVEIRILDERGRPRVEIEDRGEGIAPEHLPRIFDRLWRADPARSREHGRYGLGLAIARRHAGLLGASIEVASELGRGSVFSVVFERSEAGG